MKSGSAIAIAHELADRELGRLAGAEVLDASEVHVVDDRLQRDRRLADTHVAHSEVEQVLDRLALREAAEPAQRRQREPRQLQPLDVEIVLRAPAERELGHLLGAQAGGPHRAPDGAARAADDQRRPYVRLLERAGDPHHGKRARRRRRWRRPPRAARAAPSPAGRGRAGRRRGRPHGPIDERQRQQRPARRAQEANVRGSRAQVDQLVDPLERALERVEVERRIEGHAPSLRRPGAGAIRTNPTTGCGRAE